MNLIGLLVGIMNCCSYDAVNTVLFGFVLCYVCIKYRFFFQAEYVIRDLVRSRGLGDVYKRQAAGFQKAEK